MHFAEFIGQEQLVADIQASIRHNRVGHAYLFLGPQGVGRRTLAHLFAAALLCEESENPPCGHCHSCVLTRAGTHPDLRVVEPDGASIKIDQIRAVCAGVAMMPLLGKKKVYLLADLERLGEAAANAFLLTLEDPPPGVVVIGWATAANDLPTTIISRCQVWMMRPVPEATLAKALEARGVNPARSREIAALSAGLPGSALHMLEEADVQTADQDILAEAFLKADLAELLRSTEALAHKDREFIGHSLENLDHDLRLALVARMGAAGTIRPEFAGLTSETLWRLQRRTAEAADSLQANANIRLVLDVLGLAFHRELGIGPSNLSIRNLPEQRLEKSR